MRTLCDIRTQKTETYRTRITEGVNLIDYTGDVRTPTSDLTTTKSHVNSAIPEVKARYMCMDVKYFFLNNMMDREE